MRAMLILAFLLQHYTSFEEADAAVAGGNGLVFKGMRLKVEKSTSNVRRKPGEGNDKDVSYTAGILIEIAGCFLKFNVQMCNNT